MVFITNNFVKKTENELSKIKDLAQFLTLLIIILKISETKNRLFISKNSTDKNW